MKLNTTIAACVAAVQVFLSGQAIAVEDRAIPIDGVLNTRDLGGLKTEDGRTVRKGQLIRSGEIDDMGTGGMSVVDDLGVTAIVDLRTQREATADPIEWPEGQGPDRYNFYVMENEAQDIEDMRKSIKSGEATVEETDGLFFDAFGYIATDYTSELRGVIDVLLSQPEGEAVLYHCSGGKDRTGVTTAVVLSALGVTREDIMADFMMSNELKDADNKSVEMAAKINEQNGTTMAPEAVWPSLGVREEYLEEFYKDVEADCGSMDAYLRDGLGLTQDDLTALRERYLE